LAFSVGTATMLTNKQAAKIKVKCFIVFSLYSLYEFQ
jgi:hypothetical protein